MSSSQIIIAPSILSANFQKLQEEVDSVAPFVEWLQVDVMDGHFVPNLSFGAPVMKWIETDLVLDAHLMVSNPEERIEEFLDAGAKHITFHAEVTDTESQAAIITAIRDRDATAGIAINPDTPLETIDDEILSDIDLLLVMSVHPGFGGQSFIPDVLTKVRAARERYPKLMIQMDGGIDAETAPLCREAGADNLVSGSFIFGSENREQAIAALRK